MIMRLRHLTLFAILCLALTPRLSRAQTGNRDQLRRQDLN
jgi:hypothetical protein